MAQQSRAWITYVNFDEAVVTKAIVLAGSLRRVSTHYVTLVFAPPSLDINLCDKLTNAFDMLLFLPSNGLQFDTQLPKSSLKLAEEAFVQALTLISFQKCIFLPPNYMVLRNCDDLFNNFDTFGYTETTECYDGYQNEFGGGPLGIIPSVTHSLSLKNSLLTTDENTTETTYYRLRIWAKNNFSKLCSFESKYDVRLDIGNRSCESTELDAAIISFVGKHPLDFKGENYDDLWQDCVLKQKAVKTFQLLLEQEYNILPRKSLMNGRNFREPIAVIGLSCRLPGANNIEEFWGLLENGKNAVREVPHSRWRSNQSPVACKNRTVQAGFLNTSIEDFDNKFFGISPREAELLDPQQRLLHEVTWEAMEDALIDPLQLKGTRTGFFVGTWIYDYKDIALRVPDFDFYRAYMGNSIAASAARLSHFFETTGPSIGTESGCSSSIAAIHMACKSLQNGESNLALACGANLIIHPFDSSNLGVILAADGRCKTFDEKADGFARAEGCCAIVLKRLSDAVRDGDNIWGLIRGSAIVQEGPSRSMGTPTVQCEALAMELALEDAGVHPSQISLVEAHGTGTPVGDPMEIAAITKAYGGTFRKEPLYVGSVKTNIGHTEAVSGLAGLIKVILSMKNELIPSHLNFDTLNPEINLDNIPARIPLAALPWKRNSEQPRIAGVSSFGISGTDGHLIVQEPPLFQLQKPTVSMMLERPLHILKLSAKCEESLGKLLKNYENILANSYMKLEDIAYTANVGRATLNRRVCIIAKDSAEALSTILDKKYKITDVAGGGAKLCFLFTGQGSQYEGMARQLYNTSPIFQFYYKGCSQIIKNLAKLDLLDLMLNTNTTPERVNSSLWNQTSIFAVEYSLLKLWETWGVTPDSVLGHSLGEFAAAVAVGALDLETALELLVARCNLIDTLPKGKMLVVKSNLKHVESLLIEGKASCDSNFWLDVAAINSSDQIVLAGTHNNATQFSKLCESKGIKYSILASTHSYHSREMEPILNAYEVAASNILGKMKSQKTWKNPDCNYISGVTGTVIDTATLLDPNYWVQHCREKVNFVQGCKPIQKGECTIFLEIGPHPVLSGLTMMNMEGSLVSCLPSIRRNEENWQTLLESVHKLWVSEWHGTIDWTGFDKHYSRKKVSLPFYPFNRKRVWAEMPPHSYWPLTPLLGHLIMNPTEAVMFSNFITLKKFPYLQDHTISNRIVFPGAGFLEICLCAGHAAAQGYSNDFAKPSRPVGLKHLKIVAPLAISDMRASKIQTVTKLEEEKEGHDNDKETSFKVEVYHWLEELEDNETVGTDGKWIFHASSSFLPVLPSTITDENINVDEIQNGGQPKEWNSSEMYEMVAELGLRFGPSFQTIQKGWIDGDSKGILFQVNIPVGREEYEYMIHPVVGDAMLQAIMIWRRKISGEGKMKRLQIPVEIGEFQWLSSIPSTDTEAFIYCKTTDDGDISAALLNKNGKVLATMSSVDFIETNSKLVVGMIQQQSVLMPGLWEEVGKHFPSPMEGCIPPEVLESAPRVTQEVVRSCIENSRPNPNEILASNHVSTKLTIFQVLNAFLELGWLPQPAEKITLMELITTLGIQPKFKNYMTFFLSKMLEYKFISTSGPSEELEYVVESKLLAVVEDITQHLNEVVTPDEHERCDYRIVQEVGKNLAKVLMGRMDPLFVLFPEDPEKPHVQGIYDGVAGELEPTICCANGIFSDLFPAIKQHSPENCVRVLEVGAGTGKYAERFFKSVVPELEKQELSMEYVYTDISPVFFGIPNEQLEKYKGYISYKKLDIEQDPISQGFLPEYFDMVICSEVLHATRNIGEALKNVERVLKPGGTLQIGETIQEDPLMMFIFGLLDGYWRFKDGDDEMRRNSPILSEQKWRAVLEQCGFIDVTVAPIFNGIHAGIYAYRNITKLVNNCLDSIPSEKLSFTHTWIVFGDDFTSPLVTSLNKLMASIERKVFLVERPPSEVTSNEVELKQYLKDKIKAAKLSGGAESKVEGLLYLWGLMDEEEHDVRKISLPFLYICQDVLGSSLESTLPKLFLLTYGHDNPSACTLFGISKSVVNEYTNLAGGIICLERKEELCLQVQQTFLTLFTPTKGIECYEFKAGKRFVKRFKPKKFYNNQLVLPSSCERYRLVLPATRQISDLEFTHLDQRVLGEDQVEVRVKAMALNFRDIFSILKPIPLFDDINTVGLDFSGVVTKVGPNVEGFKPGDFVVCPNYDKNLALPSHVMISEKFVARLPDSMSFCEGATLPAAFMTSIYCLFNIGNLQKGETLLVHAASGGVGLAAIQLAMQAQASIIATAGSDRKRAYLKSLGITHVFNSRTTEFANQILQVTNGKGVDIVLNSLTGPGFKDASLKALKVNGRFVEMSKLEVWNPEEVAELRSDVAYHIVDISSLSEDTLEEIVNSIKKRMRESENEKHTIQPLPYERFDALDIRGALHHLQQAKHIGKIVCVMPEFAKENGRLTTFCKLFNDRSTYIITGGLGGIGFEVVKWMLKNGAKYIAIVSRSPKPKPEIQNQIDNFNASGKHVQHFPLDVSDLKMCTKLFKRIEDGSSPFPKIRGIMHAAGVLDDTVLENQTWSHFLNTYKPKVDGSWNLHLLTQNMKLEHFVMFSSIASSLGSPGQVNYCSSNSFQDALAHYRHSLGLPGIAINWGNWGEVGLAVEADFPGTRPISTPQGLLLLGEVLRSPKTTQIVAANIQSLTLLSKLLPTVKKYVEDASLLGDQQTEVIISGQEFWAAVDAAPDREGKLEVFKKHIKFFVRNTLKMGANEPIGDFVEFQSLGIDSLMMLEMKNSLQNVLGSRLIISASQLRDCNNVHLLANRFVDLLERKEEEAVIPTLEELRQLIHEDCKLCDDMPAVVSPPVKIRDVKVVLVTGASGSLGSYILGDISKMVKGIRKIYCLMRSTGSSSAVTDRLKQVLQKQEFEDQEVLKNLIEVIDGDVAKNNFGLEPELYEKLSEEVDAVIHLAVKSDHVAKYWKAPEDRLTHIRNVNVLGTKRVLEFATHLKTKQLFYASSMLVVSTSKDNDDDDNDNTLEEEWQENDAFDCVNYNAGYGITKFISEQLVKQAVIKGLPCKAIRLGLVSGDGKTGQIDILSSHYMVRLLAFLRLGCMQESPIPCLLLPPNLCSEAFVSLCFNDGVPSGVYNVVPSHPQLEQVFVEVAKEIGLTVELVSLSDFLQRLGLEGDDSPIAPLKRIYTENAARSMELASSVNSIRQWLDNSSPDYFVSKKLSKWLPGFQDKIEPAEKIMKRDILFAKKSRAFEIFGIRQS